MQKHRDIVVLEEWKKYIKKGQQQQKLMATGTGMEKMEEVGMENWNKQQTKQYAIRNKRKQKASTTPATQIKKAPPGFYVYLGYPMDPMPRASVYWSVIHAQCYFAHLVNSEH